MAAHQAPPTLGFSRQEHWSGLPFPSPMHESEKWKWSCSVVSDSSPPHGLEPTMVGSSVHGIFQTRGLEWGAIAFSEVLSTAPNILQLSKIFQLNYQNYSNVLYQPFSTFTEERSTCLYYINRLKRNRIPTYVYINDVVSRSQKVLYTVKV